MLPSSDGSIWLVGESGACLMTSDGDINSWVNDVPANVSNSIPFEFETSNKNAVSVPSEAHSSSGNGILWGVLAGLAVFLMAWLVATFARHARRVEHDNDNNEVSPGEIDPVLAKVIHSHEILETPDTPEEMPEVPLTPEKSPDNVIFEPVPEQKTLDEPVVPESPEAPVAPSILVPPGSTPFTDMVMELIKKNIANPAYGVDDIANDLGISRIHVNRKLRAESGASPSVLLKKTRMEMAAAMIKEKNYTLAEIAERCGFATPSYFSTAFKQYFGKTPSEFI